MKLAATEIVVSKLRRVICRRFGWNETNAGSRLVSQGSRE